MPTRALPWRVAATVARVAAFASAFQRSAHSCSLDGDGGAGASIAAGPEPLGAATTRHAVYATSPPSGARTKTMIGWRPGARSAIHEVVAAAGSSRASPAGCPPSPNTV